MGRHAPDTVRIDGGVFCVILFIIIERNRRDVGIVLSFKKWNEDSLLGELKHGPLGCEPIFMGIDSRNERMKYGGDISLDENERSSPSIQFYRHLFVPSSFHYSPDLH